MHPVISNKNQKVPYTWKIPTTEWKLTKSQKKKRKKINENLNHFACIKWLCTLWKFWVCIHSCRLPQKFAVVKSCWDDVCRTIPELSNQVCLSLFNCAVIWFIKWTNKIWGLLEGLIKQKLKVRTNGKIDNVRTFCISTSKELYYFTISEHRVNKDFTLRQESKNSDFELHQVSSKSQHQLPPHILKNLT